MENNYKKEFENGLLDLYVKVRNYIEKNSEKLMKRPNLEKIILDSFFTIKLDLSEGYSLIYNKLCSGQINITLVDQEGKDIFKTHFFAHRKFGVDEYVVKYEIDLMTNLEYKGFNPVKIEEFERVAKDICEDKLQFLDCKIIGDNGTNEGIEYFLNRCLGIQDPDILVHDYDLISPYEEKFQADVNGYNIQYHGYKNRNQEIICSNDTIKIEREYSYNGWAQAPCGQTITMHRDDYIIKIITLYYGFEVTYRNDENNFERKVILSLGRDDDEYHWRDKLKEFSVYDNGKAVLSVIAANSYYSERQNKWNRFYKVYKNGADNGLILGEDDAKIITKHPRIRDYILSVVNLVREYCPNLIDNGTFGYMETGYKLYHIINSKYEGNSTIDSIIDETIDNENVMKYDSNGIYRLLTRKPQR